ncbi:MAG: hypothetical protein RSG51_03850 [Bacilli bacterium]
MQIYPKNIIVMKVGPHSGMNLEQIIQSKIDEEQVHGVHYWGYSGVFCQPKKVQDFCKKSELKDNGVKLILIETKSSYDSNIGFITDYSNDGANYIKFDKPVQLQGAQFSFVAKNIKESTDFVLDNYSVVGGKNDGKPLSEHLKFRVNKSFATINQNKIQSNAIRVLEADLVYPYAIWLKE